MVGGYITVSATGATITTSGTSASVTIPNALSGEKPRFVRIAATAAAAVRLGKSPQTAVTTDMQVQPGDSVIVHVPSGVDTVAAIQIAAAGTVTITPLENM